MRKMTFHGENMNRKRLLLALVLAAASFVVTPASSLYACCHGYIKSVYDSMTDEEVGEKIRFCDDSLTQWGLAPGTPGTYTVTEIIDCP